MTDSVEKGDMEQDETHEASAAATGEEHDAEVAVEGEADVAVDMDVPEATEAEESESEEELDGLAEEVEDSLDAELVALREELESLNDRHLRLAAEFNNYRRRVEQERVESWSRAQADLVARFLDVLDDLQRVAELDLDNATVEAIMEGVDLVERKFARALEEAGVEIIDPEGEPFDPEVMEAMMRMPAESEEDDDVVAQVLQKGYALKGNLVRPARVSVFKHG